MNIKRTLSTVWQEYQGLGLLGGMGHGADLVRQLTIAPLLLVFPAVVIRYFLISLMWLIGPLGVYFLLKYLFKEHRILTSNISALLGSSFYLLNIGTVQNFYVPFEPYYWYFGFLPWLIYSLIHFLETKTKRSLFYFALLSFLATPIGYLQTAYVTYLFLLLFIVVISFIKSKEINLGSIKNNLKPLLVSLLINSFWLIPVIYFTLTNVDVTINAKMNTLATAEVHQQNEAYGSFSDVVRLKGYWLGLHDIADNNEFVYLMQPWRDHLEKPVTMVIAYSFFVLALLGVFYSVKKKTKYTLGLGIAFIFGLIMLGGVNWPFGPIVILLNKAIPLFEQIFRSPFTKWIVPTSFLYSIFIAFGVVGILKIFKENKLLSRIGTILVGVLILVSLFLYSTPIFKGHFIYNRAETELPQEYQSLFEFFDKEPKEARIARFPIQTFWGWDFTDWGYRGSGFLWYGIEQPILDRAFDVWSAENETYYHEISTAFYGNNTDAFKDVLNKYDVSYALIDKNVIPSGQGEGILRFEETEKMLIDIGALSVFSEGDIVVYDLSHVNSPGFVYAPEDFVEANNNTTYARRDLVYANKNYISRSSAVNYFFSDLFQEKVEAEYEGENLILNRELDNFTGNLVIPGLIQGKYYTFNSDFGYDGRFVSLDFQPQVKVKTNNSLTETNKLPNSFFEVQDRNGVLVYLGNEKIEISRGEEKSTTLELVAGNSVPIRIFENEGDRVDLSELFAESEVNECWTRPGREGSIESERRGSSLAIAAKDAVGCVALRIGQIDAGSLLTVNLPYRSSIGASKPHFCIQKEGEADCLNEDVFYSTPASFNWSSVQREVVVEESDVYWVIVGGRPSEFDEVWEIEYNAPEIEVYDSIVNLIYSENNWESLMQDTKISLVKANSLEVEIPAKLTSINMSTQGKSEIENCDIFERGEVSKETSSGVVYTAENNAAACDLVFLQNITTNKEYLLRLTGENAKGRGAKFYLYNQASMRNDLEALLGEGKFDESYSIFDWPELSTGNYTFNLGVRSFDRDAESRIDTISLYQTPVEWLAGWQLKTARSGFVVDDEESVYSNNLKIGESNKIRSYKYKVDLTGDGLVVLSQSYDDGWIAYSGNIFGEKLEHVKYNGWANGWIVPRTGEEGLGTNNADSNTQSLVPSTSIVIVYWPQYLQFAGYGILALTLGILSFPMVAKRLEKR